MSENKKKYAYWMKPSMVEEMTEMLDTANATSKSDFVCQAVNFYIGYLHQQKCIDYLSPMLAQTFSGIVLTLAKLIANSCKRKRAKLFGQVDSKLKSKLEEKKVAHGLKTDRTVNRNEIENDEEQGFTMSM